MSKKGEIDKLTKLIRPHFGIITNIGEAHIENFKNLKDIAKAKAEIIKNISTKGSLIIDRDSKYYNFFKSEANRRKIKVYSIGYNQNSQIQIIKIENQLKHKIATIKSFDKVYKIKFKDQLIKNILFTIATLEILNLNVDR